MKNFEKVKAMSLDELAELIEFQSCNKIIDDFCKKYCEYGELNHGCKSEEKHGSLICTYDALFCKFEDVEIIKKWLESEVFE